MNTERANRPTSTAETYPADPAPVLRRPEPLVKPRAPTPFPADAPRPEPKYQDQRTTFRVRVLPAADGMVRDNRVMRAGEVIELPVTQAQQFVRFGHGEWTCMVKSLADNISAGDYVLSVGDVAPCAPDRAGLLAARGLVELVAEDTPVSLGGRAVGT